MLQAERNYCNFSTRPDKIHFFFPFASRCHFQFISALNENNETPMTYQYLCLQRRNKFTRTGDCGMTAKKKKPHSINILTIIFIAWMDMNVIFRGGHREYQSKNNLIISKKLKWFLFKRIRCGPRDKNKYGIKVNFFLCSNSSPVDFSIGFLSRHDPCSLLAV